MKVNFFATLFFVMLLGLTSCKDPKKEPKNETSSHHQSHDCFVHEYDFILKSRIISQNKSQKINTSQIYQYTVGDSTYYSINEIDFESGNDTLFVYRGKLNPGDFGLIDSVSGNFISKLGIRSTKCGQKMCIMSLGNKSCWNPGTIITQDTWTRPGKSEPDILLELLRMTYHENGAPQENPRTEYWHVTQEFINDIKILEAHGHTFGFGSDHYPNMVEYVNVGQKWVHDKEKVFIAFKPK